jgi:ABC-type dipeptide/oligopeptide/nickel transport system permease subunit
VQLITSSPSLVLVPGLALVLTVLSINLFGEGLRNALDPKFGGQR